MLWSAPVRYVECDAQGVVFHAHYLTWCDEASGALLSRAGTEHADLLARGLDYAVVASTLSWSSSARWGDSVTVDGAPERVGRTSFVVRYEVRVGERLCCTVTTTYVVVDTGGRAVRVPDDLRAALGG